MWVQSIITLSFVFVFAVFAIILVLHSSGFDPDTKDVPKHLKALKTLAWALAGLCIYYNAGEIQEPLLGHTRNAISIIACVLIIGLWYISKLPTWYQQLPGDRGQGWQGDSNPREVCNRDTDGIERSLSIRTTQDSEARREIWKLQQRGRFPQLQNEPVPNFTREERALGCGYAAYHYVESCKHHMNGALDFREVIWWIDRNDRTLKSVSEFADRSRWDPMPDVAGADKLRGNRSALFMTCVSVINPEHIRPAVDLIRSTLDKVSYYDKYGGEVSRTQFKYSVAVDCEFWDSQGPGDEDRCLVSCMTVCVDKILAVNFHIYHMITSERNLAGASAVVLGIEYLFLSLILDPEIIKVWFNYGQDIGAMDATLDEIYRGTPRPSFKTYTRQEGWREWVNPGYKLTLNAGQTRAFSGTRPGNLTFHKIRGSGWGTECPYGFHTNAVDVFGRPCPCRTNNLDLAVVTEFIIRDLKMEDPRLRLRKRPWTEIRYLAGYSCFESCMLLGDKHQELLGILGDIGVERAHPRPIYPAPCPTDCLEYRCQDGCPNFRMKRNYGNAVRGFRERFSENFSHPRFQEIPALLGYVIGDVVGLALVIRFLMTTEKPRLLAERLRLWSSPINATLPVPRFGRPMRGIHGYERKPDYGERESYYRLIRCVPMSMDHPPHAKRDLIGWDISGDQHIRNALGRDERWRLIETNNSLNMIWQFFKSNPILFGDFIFSYSRKLTRPILRDFNGQHLPVIDEHERIFRERAAFSKEAIKAIFQQRSFYDVCLGLLPMLISQLELMLLDELKKDNENVIRMVQQYDTHRRRYGVFASEADKRRLLDARKVLGEKNEDPDWKPTGTIIPLELYPVSRWIFQPFQKFAIFPDRYDLGFRLLEKLIDEFRNLESAGRRRREQFESRLIGLAGEGEITRLSEAATAGVTLFADSDSESKWILRDEQRDVRGHLESFIAFWVRLFFNTPTHIAVDDGAGGGYPTYSANRGAHGVVRGTQLAEKVFDLMFSPINFYMPEFRNTRPEPGMSTKAPTLPSVGGVVAPPFERDNEEPIIPETLETTAERQGDVVVAEEGGAWNATRQHSTREVERTPRELQFVRLFARWTERLLGPADTWDAFPT